MTGIHLNKIFHGERFSDRVLLFITAIFLHATFWTFAPTYFMSNYMIDTMEMMVIGQNWVISTFKHPAFQGWIVEIFSMLSWRAEFVPYLASQTACVLTVFVVWKFAQKILTPNLALLAALTLLSYLYFHYDSTTYNNRTFMRFFWVLAVYFLYLALENNRKRDWIFTGLALGFGIYCQLTIVLLIVVILLFMFFEPRAKKYWKTPGPYLSTGTCFLVTLPLLFWLIQYYSLMVSYTFNSIGKAQSEFWDHLISPTSFFVTQIPIILVLLIPLYALLGFRWRFDWNKIYSSPTGRYLTFFIFVPFVMQLIIAFLCAGDMRTALGCHLWLLLPLFLLYTVKIPVENEKFYSRSMKLVFVNIFVFATISVLVIQLSPLVSGRASRYHFSGKELAQTVQTIWLERYSTPIPFVRGDDWLTEAVNVYLRPNPTVYSELWATEEQFSQNGGVLLWLDQPDQVKRRSIRGCFGNRDFNYSSETGKPDRWLKQFPNAIILPPINIEQRTIIKVAPITVGIAIVPPIKQK
ncbi:MAG: glycosyltransferase family 39 protein [Planctomycetaceae bacterium]|jgi:4-amino-4-deoxy-L-arabinose transferase-like glycosyltransferase|nr:glycosyltransferase family 39 protein [Planctomycetaceae bacterium]